MNRMYPFQIDPKLVPAIWGGDALVSRYGKTGDAAQPIGESWECWAGNTIANGTCAGETLSQAWMTSGPALMGLVPLASRTQFPLLTKLIDARDWLSVQVHPDDAYAQRVESKPNGKTECWVILEAAPDAEIVLGFSRDTDKAEVQRRAKDGSLSEILRRVKVNAGDVFFLPAGTVHAIGKGIVLFETQQASELTYRLFDWNRKGADGKPRELHVDKAADVLHYQKATLGAIEPIEYRIEGHDRRALISDDRFGVEEILLNKSAKFFTESICIVLTAKETPIRVRGIDDPVEVKPWSTVIIPAGIPRLEIEAESQTGVFLVTPPGARDRLRSRLELIGFDSAKRDAFFAQFGAQPASV